MTPAEHTERAVKLLHAIEGARACLASADTQPTAEARVAELLRAVGHLVDALELSHGVVYHQPNKHRHARPPWVTRRRSPPESS